MRESGSWPTAACVPIPTHPEAERRIRIQERIDTDVPGLYAVSTLPFEYSSPML